MLQEGLSTARHARLPDIPAHIDYYAALPGSGTPFAVSFLRDGARPLLAGGRLNMVDLGDGLWRVSVAHHGQAPAVALGHALLKVSENGGVRVLLDRRWQAAGNLSDEASLARKGPEFNFQNIKASSFDRHKTLARGVALAALAACGTPSRMLQSLPRVDFAIRGRSRDSVPEFRHVDIPSAAPLEVAAVGMQGSWELEVRGLRNTPAPVRVPLFITARDHCIAARAADLEAGSWGAPAKMAYLGFDRTQLDLRSDEFDALIGGALAGISGMK